MVRRNDSAIGVREAFALVAFFIQFVGIVILWGGIALVVGAVLLRLF